MKETQIPIRLQMARGFHIEGHLDEAKNQYQLVLDLDPRNTESLHMLGAIEAQHGCLHKALAYLMDAIEQSPRDAYILNNIGSTLFKLKNHSAALSYFDRSIQISSTQAEAHCNRASTLSRLGENHEAMTAITRAIELNGNYAEAYNVRGMIYEAIGNITLAMNDFKNAIKISPSHAKAHWNMAVLYLREGEWSKGWILHEWRWEAAQATAPGKLLCQPLWQGDQALEGKRILLQSEQGLGDTLQFCRYIPLIHALGADVLLQAQKPLLGLLSSLNGLDELYEDGQNVSGFDLHCPLMSLPLAFQTITTNVPRNTPYLFADSTRVMQWARIIGNSSKPRIGLAWSGNPNHENDRNRNIFLGLILSFLPQHVEYYVLQKDIREADKAALNSAQCIYDHSCLINDFSDTAAICELMDLVISVDTSVAHLAGALGKPLWIMLPEPADWRWLKGRTDCLWYPRARLFRQSTPGDWLHVLEKIKSEIEAVFPQK